MNGFEPLRRRIIDYTEAGQWSEVYDGPLEDCESERLKAENDKLVMKLNAEHIVRQNMERENVKLRELVRDMLVCINNVSAHDTYCWDYCDFCKMYTTKGRCDFESRMRELGVGHERDL